MCLASGAALSAAVCLLVGVPLAAQTAHVSGAVASLGSGFGFPTGAAVDGSGNVFVADYRNNAVKEIVAAGGYTTINTLGSGFSNPWGVAVDGSGNVFVADYGNSAVKEIVAAGGYTTVKILGSGFNSPHGVAVDGSGDVFVADTDSNAVKEIPASCIAGANNSTCMQTLGSGFSTPQGVAVEGSGDVFVADHGNSAVKEIPASCIAGANNSSCVLTLGGGFSFPGGVALDRSGNVFVADTDYNEVKEIPSGCSNASCVLIVGSTLGTGTYSPAGLAVDAQGDVYVADGTYTTIQVIMAGGNGNFGPVSIGSTSAIPLTFYFTFDTGGTGVSNAVLTEGATGLDFTDAGTGTCDSNNTSFPYEAGDSCTVNVVFKPIYAGTRDGAVLLKNSSGAAIATAYVYGAGMAPELAFKPGIIETVAGNGTEGYSGNGGLATSAELYEPFVTAVDSAGNLYIADDGSSTIRKVTASTGIITTAAGNGTFGYSGDGGPATSAELSAPGGVAVDSAGNIYIGDWGNNCVRKVTTSTGIITTVAGNGTAGYSGDGGPATSAEIESPNGVRVDSAGNLYIADWNQRIRKVSVLTGIITTVAGNGTAGYSGDGGLATSAELSYPFDVAVDGAGNLYISDQINYRIRKVTASTGIITTVAGNGNAGYSGDGGSATSAELSEPGAVAVDSAGNLYTADIFNNRIREVSASTGIITTIAGNGTAGYSGDGGPATSAELGEPGAAAVDSAGDLYIADTANNRIRKVSVATTALSFVSATAGSISTDSPQTVTVQNIGNQALTFTALSYPTDFPEASGVSTDCSITKTVDAGADCTLSIDFSPLLSSLKGNSTNLSESVSLTDNTLNGTSVKQSVSVSGTETASLPSLTSPSASPLAGATKFTWNPGSGSTMFALWIGTSPETYNVYTSGHVANTVTTETVNIPANGATLYVSLWYEINGTWSDTTYIFTEAALPSLTSPTSSPISGSTKFTWNPGSGSTMFALWIGTTAGTNNLYTSGHVANTVTSETVNIPANGATLYVSLWYELNGVWSDTTYTFTEGALPSLTSPTTSPLSGATTFTWSPGSGSTMFAFWIGTTAGTNNLYTSGHVANTVTSETVNIPANGATLYVSLWYELNGYWSDTAYTFTEAAPPSLTSPTSSPLSGATQFTWSPGTGSSMFALWIGTTAGTNNLYTSGHVANTVTSETVNIPANGATLYVSLWYELNGVWTYKSYTFTEAP